MSHIFFLASALPPLELDGSAEIFFDKLLFLYEENLGPKDRAQLKVLRLWIDLSNICRVMESKPIDMRGNLSEPEIDEALIHRLYYPESLFEFLDRYENRSERVRYFPYLELLFLKHQAAKYSGFLAFYFRFEFELRVLLASVRAAREGVSIFEEIDKEPELASDSFVQQMKAQKDQENIVFPDEYSDLKEMLEKAGESPLEQYEAMQGYKFTKIKQVMEENIFSLDYILGYFTLFLLVEDYQKLKAKQQHQWLEMVCEGIG